MSDRSGILKNSPLAYTLASVRFAPWPLLAERFPLIQDALRDIAPLIHEIQIQAPIASPSMQPEFSTSRLWMMLSPDRSFGIQLAADQMLVFTKKYARYSDFEVILDRVLGELLKLMRFIDVNTMGVRFIDHIKTDSQQELKKYLAAELLAPSFDGFDQLGGASVTHYSRGDSELRVRYINHPGQPSLSEDLIGLLVMAQDPSISTMIPSLKEGEAIIDMDAISHMAMPVRFDTSTKALAQLRSLHTVANDFFRHPDVFTDYAFSSWKGENVK